MFDIASIKEARDVRSAINLLCEDPDAMIIAGGSDVLIQIREGKLAGKSLVSIHDVQELKGITKSEDGTIVIGPLCTFAEVAENDIIKAHVPTLGYAVDQAGGPQLRNIGTIGGNVCNGVTSADSAATLLTLNATLTISGPDTQRSLPLADFYKGPGKVDLAQNEILTAISIAKSDYENYHGCYIKFAQRNAMDIATLGCAVHAKLSSDKTKLEDLRLAFGVAAAIPVRCRATEEKAKGCALDACLLDLVAENAPTELSPRTSWRATKEFRLQLICELSKRALKESIVKAGGNF